MIFFHFPVNFDLEFGKKRGVPTLPTTFQNSDCRTVIVIRKENKHTRSDFFIRLNQILSGDALHDLVPFVQFKKREKHPWRNVTFSKVAS